jgi:hypothetical protein
MKKFNFLVEIDDVIRNFLRLDKTNAHPFPTYVNVKPDPYIPTYINLKPQSLQQELN